MIQFLSNTWVNGSNQLGKDGQVNTQILILGVIVLVVSLILSLTFSKYLYDFKKNDSKHKIYGINFIIIFAVLNAIAIFSGILGMILFSNAKSIFGANSNIDNGANVAFAVIVTILAIGFAVIIGSSVLLWFGIYKFGIALDKEKVLFIGEKILYSKITKIIDDKGKIYINYLQGIRTNKRFKLSKSSVMGQWFIQNVLVTGHSIEKMNADEYFKNMNVLAKKELEEKQSQKAKEKK
ncbi:hypothetical protein CXP39_02655 [Mesoplasma syrphidae]|uniref:Uncharacterized protein n=1 Tax=Mesoplasma syrphidae TaxID=225999 RepID=A0A2K9BKC5_9MOLU|nr:hypothetical protein [Mesoplasma syrphidae]AUF83686.1 hypothetical protein CXP39_02655 [Mesoplasma syrphidae]